MDIKHLIEAHKNVKLPSFPNDDTFSEWVEDLMEMDAYYMGYAMSQNFRDYGKINFDYFKDSKAKLAEFQYLLDDNSIYLQSLEFLSSLEQIVTCLSPNKR